LIKGYQDLIFKGNGLVKDEISVSGVGLPDGQYSGKYLR